MNGELEEIKKYLSAQDIADISAASGVQRRVVRMFLDGKIKRSKCAKYVYARARTNRELVF